MHRFPLLTLVAAAFLLLSTACEGSHPLASGVSGTPDLPEAGSSFHESGAIQSVSLSGTAPTQMTLVLGGNVQIRVTGATVIDAGGDLTTLEEVEAAVDEGIPVRVEIDGTIADGLITATHVRFETDGAEAADDEVHAIVAAVDVGARTVTLADGRAIRVASDALIETDGDFLTLAQVGAALAAGLEVRVEAHLGPIAAGVREATSAKFESDEADGPGDDDNSGPGNGDGEDNSGPGNAGDDNSGPGNGGGDDNSGPGNGDDDDLDDDEVQGIVVSVDPSARTVTTSSGMVIRVADDAMIEADGDIRTLTEVATRLPSGAPIRVEARGALLGGVFVATLAKFEG
ncbi:MAG TPA: hypothetical protein VFS53_02295 [Gemmatimonadota bacterium]|nr:hypothetical protein [Gemmatimonadota bacterium]